MSGRFSEEEARQIFARAAERQHAVEARGEGLTAEELQAIGAEAGLDPAHVAAAVAELRAAPADPVPLVYGVDPAPRRVRVVPGELTDETWGRLVSRFKRTFGDTGIASGYGAVREWTSGPTSNLHVVAEPVEGGTRITMETRRENAAAPIWGLPGVGVAMLLLFVVLGAAQGKLGDPAVWILMAMSLALALGGGAGSYRSLKTWSAMRTAQFEALLDDAELLLAASAPAASTPEAPGRIDASLLDADAEADAPGSAAGRRQRAR